MKKYQLKGEITLPDFPGMPALVNPVFWRYGTFYPASAPMAEIQVAYQIYGLAGPWVQNYRVPCESGWLPADAEAAMLAIEGHKDAELIKEE